MDLHPYDGRERRFRDSDEDRRAGLEILAGLLEVASLPGDARYDLSFYSGGIGVLDHLAIAARGVEPPARLWLPERAIEDPQDRDCIECLVGCDDEAEPPVPLRAAIAAFIEEHREPWQPACAATDEMWIDPTSGVNAWSIGWRKDGVLGYLGFDQG